jgi:hypothetical protein
MMITENTMDHLTLTNPSNLCNSESILANNLIRMPDSTSGTSHESNIRGHTSTSEETTTNLLVRVKETIYNQRQEFQHWINDSNTTDYMNTQDNGITNNNDHNIRIAPGPIDTTTNNNMANSPAGATERIIQWNVTGFYTRLDDIKLLVEEYDPTVLCLQKTRLNKKDRAKLSGFRTFLDSAYTRNRGGCHSGKERHGWILTLKST